MGGSYIIKNATVVSIDNAIGTVPNCDVLIEDGVIKGVGPNLDHPPSLPTIDGTNAIVSPGFIDTHRHTWQTQLRTIGSDFVLSDYILALRQIYGASYTAEDAYLGNYVGALDSIDNGITYLVDHSHIINSPEHADAAIKGLRDAKIRATFCYAMYANPYWDGSCLDKRREEDTPGWRLNDAKRVADQFFDPHQPDDLVRMGFALSEPDLTPIDRLVEEIEYARSIGCNVITGHFNFGKWDPGNVIIRQLGQKGLLGPDLLLSHGNTLRDDELAYVAKHGCGISSTPDTELQMGMSHPVAFKARDRGCVASLGVDVCCSAPADIFAQMRLLLQAQRHLEHEAQPSAPLKMSRSCWEVLEMATLGGARAVGLDKIIGSITPGKRADLLITRCDAPRLVPVHDPVGALVLYANGSDVDTVMINGEIVKSGGKLVNVDWPALRQRMRASVDNIVSHTSFPSLSPLVRGCTRRIARELTRSHRWSGRRRFR
jgi:cytosine/adenosine deaminase-related metal-dependent hydrolase